MEGSHKWMLALKGSGLLYIRKEVQDRIRPVFLRSGHAPYTASSGTRNVAQIIGHGVAMAFHERIGCGRVEERCMGVRAVLRSRLEALPGVRVITSPHPSMASGIVSVSLKGASAREVAGSLKQQDIVVKVIPVAEYNGLRFSTHVYNSETEIERLVGGLAEHLGAG